MTKGRFRNKESLGDIFQGDRDELIMAKSPMSSQWSSSGVKKLNLPNCLLEIFVLCPLHGLLVLSVLTHLSVVTNFSSGAVDLKCGYRMEM